GDPRDLGARKLEEDHLEHREQRAQRQHREGDRLGRVDDHRHERRVAHDRNSPASNMTMIGPAAAMPSSPKPSLTADRPESTALTPIARARTTGVVRTPVVTLPAS